TPTLTTTAPSSPILPAMPTATVPATLAAETDGATASLSMYDCLAARVSRS
ncbi:hypothetical protein PKD domain containing protein, partial [Aspergillus fumigatus]